MFCFQEEAMKPMTNLGWTDIGDAIDDMVTEFKSDRSGYNLY